MKDAILTLTLTLATVAHAATFEATAFGARPDGKTDNTAALQKAIDTCSAKGGGTVLVSGGVFKTYTLNLKNNVELKIDRGATLKGGEEALKYPVFPPTKVWRSDRCPRWNHRAMFYTVGQTNVAITGAGTIDGNAEAFHHRVNGIWQRISHTNITGRCVFFAGCRDVRFDDVLVYHPSGWSTWFLDCDRVQCHAVRIECHHEFPNGDGLHFGGCRDVTVSDCIIDSQDDAIILRSHQEQMFAPKPCERVTVANCTLRSNQSAIRIGWTGDAEVKDATFSNIVCPYSRLGVQFYLPKLGNPLYHVDPVRGNGVGLPDFPLAPFAVKDLRFDNMQINCFNSPFYIDIGATERVAYIKDITFSNCKFVSQLPPTFKCRPEDGVSNWRFSNVEFSVQKPRGAPPPNTGLWFDNAKDITFDNVKWSYFPQEMPEWSIVVQQIAAKGEKPAKLVRLSGARQPCTIEKGADGVKRFICERLTNGGSSWRIRVVIEEREVNGGREYTGFVENNDAGIRVRSFQGPFYDRVKTNPRASALYLPDGLGRRVRNFPNSTIGLKPLPAIGQRLSANWYLGSQGNAVYATDEYPGVTGMTMPWYDLEGERGGIYAGVHDATVGPRRMIVRYNAHEEKSDLAFEHATFVAPGETWQLPKTVFVPHTGGWHAAARRYRAWYDTVRKIGVCSPAWTSRFSGWLLVIMRQQNESLIWPYTDIPKLCDVAEANGLNCIGLFGWTKGGHDHLYPDYDPDPKMGGVEAIKAGIAEAHRRGIWVYVYANGQLQQVGATKFWQDHGQYNALIREDGSRVIQNYHKYSDSPKYDFALGCLWSKPWAERMLSLAYQAEGFGADGILYDQLGIFDPFPCWGEGHGHATPGYAYANERTGFIRNIADEIQKKNRNFAILTEGLHDTILDSISAFHGCENGTYPWIIGDILSRSNGGKAEVFPELWRYTFPELITTTRVPSPLVTRTMVNYNATFGFRHDIELRYAPDRRYVLEARVPTRKDYGTVNDVPDVSAMQANDPKKSAAYLKAVNLLMRKYAKYTLEGRFVDDEGFTLRGNAEACLAKRFVAKDGSSAVIVWNMGKKSEVVSIEGLGEVETIEEPQTKAATVAQPIKPDSIRIHAFGKQAREGKNS